MIDQGTEMGRWRLREQRDEWTKAHSKEKWKKSRVWEAVESVDRFMWGLRLLLNAQFCVYQLYLKRGAGD
jgi:hypothetical protein